MFSICLRRAALCLTLGLAAWPALAAPPVAFGLIVGYRQGADELHRENTDRGPWADRRQREAAVWMRAAQRSRERTADVARSAGVPVVSVGEAGRAALMRLPRPLQGRELEDTMRRVRLHPDVAWVEPNVIERRQLVPTDPGWSNQWHLREPTVLQPAGINMPTAWDQTTGAGSATVVAVVDTGVRFDHPDLGGRLLAGYDFVSEVDFAGDGNGRDGIASDEGDWVTRTGNAPVVQQYVNAGLCGDFSDPGSPNLSRSSWHGTFIAGQIAAVPNNGAGVAGVHWGARILPVRVAGKCGAMLSDLFDGARWAAGLPVADVPTNATPARVVNISFGGSSACSPAYQSMVDDVTAAGALLVVAAGNNAQPLKRPADCQGVMAVASVRRDGAKAEYSSFGPNVALSAPGGTDDLGNATLLYSTYNAGAREPGANNYSYQQGTSFSAPLAAGVAALMLTVNPQLTPTALLERMKLGARPHTVSGGAACGPANPLTCVCTTTTCGAGLLDANNALQLALGPAAVIQQVGDVLPGAQITLDGSASQALPGSTLTSYRWTQDSGPVVAIPSDTQSQTSVVLPAGVEGRWVFRLTVQDNQSRSGSDAMVVVAARPVATAAAPTGGGGGALAWWWGLGLWAWALAVARSQRRTA